MVVVLLVGCGFIRERPVAAPSNEPSVFALASFPFESPWNHELSGIVWDDASSVLYVVSDEAAQISVLKPNADFSDWAPGPALKIRAPGIERWDGEGLSLYGGGFLVATERPPAMLVIDRDGSLLRELPLPPHFTRCHSNRGLESMTVTPDHRFAFTANEAPLEGDGPQPTFETRGRVRILRTELETMKQVELAYETERVSFPGVDGELGVADMAALSQDEVLVLERSYIPPDTLDVRIYRASLREANLVPEGASLAQMIPVEKRLIVSLSALEPGGPAPPAQGYRVLSNYEGMALGPRLPDGRTALFLVSDDNGRPEQTRRLLTLALPASAIR